MSKQRRVGVVGCGRLHLSEQRRGGELTGSSGIRNPIQRRIEEVKKELLDGRCATIPVFRIRKSYFSSCEVCFSGGEVNIIFSRK